MEVNNNNLLHWLDRVIVPPNRALLVQPHLPVWAGLSLVYRSAFYGYHQRGEVMRARYPDQVGGDNLEIQRDKLPGGPG